MRYLYLVFVAAAFAQAAHADAIERFKSFVRTTQSARADFEQNVYGRDGRMTQA
jgi:outer membrane lipoprotein-sorting protein